MGWGADEEHLGELRGREPGSYYRLWQWIGVGSVGAVYEALDGRGRKWAIKVLHAVAGDDTAARRFERAAHAALALEHPNIARVVDFVAHPHEAPFLVMERLVGCSLHEVLKRRKRLAPERAVRIALHVLAALEAAHAAGVVHRDIKPENIFLVAGPDGGDMVKVLDFGAAKILGEATGKPIWTAIPARTESTIGDWGLLCQLDHPA